MEITSSHLSFIRLRRESTNLHASLEDLVNKSIRDDSSLTTAEEDTYHTIGDSAQEEDQGIKMKTPTGKGGDPTPSGGQQKQAQEPKTVTVPTKEATEVRT